MKIQKLQKDKYMVFQENGRKCILIQTRAKQNNDHT